MKMQSEKIYDVIGAVAVECERAMSKHGSLSSAHEAYAVMLEEFDEYKAEVWKKSELRDKYNMRTELTQLAAMCVRTIIDLNL